MTEHFSYPLPVVVDHDAKLRKEQIRRERSRRISQLLELGTYITILVGLCMVV